MGKGLLLLLMISSLIIIPGCSNDNYVGGRENDNSFNDIINIQDKIAIEDDVFDYLIEDYYNIGNLEKYEFFRIEDAIFAQFHFKKEVSRLDILHSKDMIWDILVMQRGSKFGPNPEVLYNQEPWNKVYFSVLIDNVEIWWEAIEKATSGAIHIDYNENSDIILSQRLIDDDDMLELKNTLKRKHWWKIKDVTFQKSFKGNVLLVNIDCRSKLKNDDIAYVKGLIEKDFSKALAEKSIEIYGGNMDYLGIVLQLYHRGEKYLVEAYYNGDNGFWIDEYWGNFDYYNPIK